MLIVLIICLHFDFLHISDLNYVEEVKGYAVSKNGRALLVDQRNYTYWVERKKGNRMFWRCSSYKRYKCKGRASTYENYIMKLGATHNHEPDMTEKILEKNVNE